jgi:hypothetical protein
MRTLSSWVGDVQSEGQEDQECAGQEELLRDLMAVTECCEDVGTLVHAVDKNSTRLLTTPTWLLSFKNLEGLMTCWVHHLQE